MPISAVVEGNTQSGLKELAAFLSAHPGCGWSLAGHTVKPPRFRSVGSAACRTPVLCTLSGAGTRLSNDTMQLMPHTALIIDSSCSGAHLSHPTIYVAGPVHKSMR